MGRGEGGCQCQILASDFFTHSQESSDFAGTHARMGVCVFVSVDVCVSLGRFYVCFRVAGCVYIGLYVFMSVCVLCGRKKGLSEKE